MEDKPGQSELDQLEDRLERIREAEEKNKPRHTGSGKAMSVAFRIIAELVIGIMVGTAMGWFLDDWLGTAPWLMIVFFILGFVAGLINVTRAAREMATTSSEMTPGTERKEKEHSGGT